MKIENFTEKDLPFIASLKNECYGDIVKPHKFYLSLPLCHPRKIVYRNELVAVDSIMVFSHTAWLCHVIVSPDWRTQGIGRFLIQSLIDLAKNEFDCNPYLLLRPNQVTLCI